LPQNLGRQGSLVGFFCCAPRFAGDESKVVTYGHADPQKDRLRLRRSNGPFSSGGVLCRWLQQRRNYCWPDMRRFLPCVRGCHERPEEGSRGDMMRGSNGAQTPTERSSRRASVPAAAAACASGASDCRAAFPTLAGTTATLLIQVLPWLLIVRGRRTLSEDPQRDSYPCHARHNKPVILPPGILQF